LEGLEPAIGRTDDGHQLFDTEMIEQRALGGDDVAHRDIGQFDPLGLPVAGSISVALVDP
jgi:hypothetical protein